MTPTAAVRGTLPFMHRNISLWLSTRHPVSLLAAAPDNACLSVYIHGILILFLCLGWGSGGEREYCECFSSRETEVGPTRDSEGSQSEKDHRLYVPGATYNSHNPLDFPFWGILLSSSVVCVPVGFIHELVSWWKDEEKHGITILADHTGKSDHCVCYWAQNDHLVAPGLKDQENSLVSMSKSGESVSALLCFCLVVGFLTEHARGLSRFPTLDTERMWKRKAWPSHRSHCDLGAWCGAKRPTCRLDSPSLLTFDFYI